MCEHKIVDNFQKISEKNLFHFMWNREYFPTFTTLHNTLGIFKIGTAFVHSEETHILNMGLAFLLLVTSENLCQYVLNSF